MKTLIIYFSTEFGATKKLAEDLAGAMSADTFEITPSEPYTKADISYMNPLARCNKEYFGKKDVPVTGYPDNFDQYGLVLIGFPIWYGCAPNVVNTFCKTLDFSGKKVALFATSGGSGIGKTAAKLAPYVKGTDILDARLFNNADLSAVKAWAEGL